LLFCVSINAVMQLAVAVAIEQMIWGSNLTWHSGILAFCHSASPRKRREMPQKIVPTNASKYLRNRSR
jgi:hypothetical protein